jgi:ABC-2 type transport system permease protein
VAVSVSTMPVAAQPRQNTFWLVFRHEAKVLAAERSLWMVLALFLGLMAISLYNGVVETRHRDRGLAEVAQEEARREAANIELLRKIMAGQVVPDPFANPADPSLIADKFGARYAIMPTAPLAPLAFGQADMFPNSYLVTNRSKVTFMYDSEMENPWSLLSGHLDLSFVFIYFLPLLIFALSYNLLSAEREQGTLRILLSQPLRLASLVAGKTAVRAAVLLGIAVVVPAIALLIARPEARDATQIGAMMSWLGIIVAYGLFWFALTVFVNSLGKSSATNALILISTWVALVLIVPVVLNLIFQIVSPAPSRTELATRTRIITAKGLDKYNALLSTEYRYTAQPDVLIPRNGRIEVPERRRGLILVQKDVDADVQEVLDRFDQQLARQQELVDATALTSPAIVAFEGMAALAGTGSKRYAHFHRLVYDYHERWKQYFDQRILDGLAITEADFQKMPRFQWREPSHVENAGATLVRITQLTVPTLLLLGLAGLWLRRYRPV